MVKTIESDGGGYYLYLPATFLYQDFQYGFARDPEFNHKYGGGPAIAVDEATNGRFYNRYYMGSSILMAPFFGLACLLARLLGYPVDGYSLPFQIMVFLAALSYMLAGLELFRQLLIKFKIKPFTAVISMLILGLATNLFTYAWYYPSFSHVYAFFLVTALFYCIKLFVDYQKTKHLALSLLLIGLIVITRPTTVLCLLALPIIFNSWQHFVEVLKLVLSRYKWLVLGAVFSLLLITIQLLLYRYQFGNWEIWAYKTDFFDFSKPHFWQFLFGYRKGLFVYSPVFWLLLPGLALLVRTKQGVFTGVLISFVVISFILSCWNQWWFGGGFSSRSLIDYFAVFFLPIAFLIQRFSRYLIAKVGVVLVALVLVLLSFTMNLQFKQNIIAYDHMTKAKFWQVFLETRPVFYYSTYDPEKYLKQDKIVSTTAFRCTDTCSPLTNVPKEFIDKLNENAIKVYDKNAFGLPIKFNASAYCPQGFKTIFKYKAQVKIEEKATSAVVVCSVDGKDGTWRSIKINRMVRKVGEWVNIECEFPAYNSLEPEDILVFYLLNGQNDLVWLKNVEVEFYHHNID